MPELYCGKCGWQMLCAPYPRHGPFDKVEAKCLSPHHDGGNYTIIVSMLEVHASQTGDHIVT